MDIEALNKEARRIRATCVQMAHDSRHGHLKSALSCVDILVALFSGFLRIQPDKPRSGERDRFFFSKGHGCASLYAILASRGFVPREELGKYGCCGSAFPTHPCRHMLPVLECSSGSLGHALGIATGSLYGLRIRGSAARCVVLMSDGECNEGSVWESAMFAAAQKMTNLLAIVDFNKIQAVGRSNDIMGHTSLEEKFRAFGWAARSVNGGDIASMIKTLSDFPFEQDRPSAIIADTVSGAGISFMEDQVLWHYRVPSDDDLTRALQELGETPIHKL